ncbi:MaoC family dehydratase [Neptunomonas qingdaonensis]|uniref:3-hydroxybutyryl-CoA dehydratase n=1 Tax=Neptunomonas qingdaonensis TaxID=1045558 RepID=A0A1I2VBQ1_9GAMM|nr:MaoC family dehydratase [Neptunomonas qingdaonensis]SFG86503.1 3-hydroxybutyryl-CoA dehydratase [Neptunomonas qingdaonensis]
MQELHGFYLEDLSIGQSASYAKTITEADVVLFAGISGDDNPVHINAEYAAQTMFKDRIVHGMFSAALISAVLGTRMPGPGAIYVDQQISFKAPVYIGDTVTATATVIDINPERRRVTLETICSVKGKVVAQGVATNMVDRRPVEGK